MSHKMKFIILGLVCLICAIALADDPEEPSDEVDGEEETPDANDFSYVVSDPFVLSITKKLNWFEATTVCAQRGYPLVSIGNLSKQQSLYRAIARSGLQVEMNEPVWTSGSNLANGAVWSWYSNGRPFTYRNFQNQYVNGTYGCLAYDTINGYWTAELCTDKRFFICECA